MDDKNRGFVYLFKYFFVVRLVILVTRLQVTTLGYFKMLNERHAFEVIRNGTLLLDKHNLVFTL